MSGDFYLVSALYRWPAMEVEGKKLGAFTQNVDGCVGVLLAFNDEGKALTYAGGRFDVIKMSNGDGPTVVEPGEDQ